MLAKMGDILYRRRITALFVALALVIGATYFGLGVFGSLSNTGFDVENSESLQADQVLRTKFRNTSNDVVILLSSETLLATDATFTQAATALLSELNKRPEVTSLTSYYGTQNRNFISRDGHETFALLRLKGENFSEKQKEYTRLKPVISSQVLQVRIGGSVPIQIAVNEQANEDLKRAELLTLPVVVVLLLFIFGGVIAAGLPLSIGVIAILGALAVLRGLTLVTDVSVYAINIVTILGLGLAIDYSLFMVSRFREELSSNGQNVRVALERTMTSAGRTVIFSALTVSTSLLSLLPFPLGFLRSLGLGAIAAIFMVMLVSLTILPALLALLGTRVNALSLRRLIRPRRPPGTSPKTTSAGEQRGIWYRLSEVVMRRPVSVTLIVLTVLVTLGLPFSYIKFGEIGIKDLSASNESRVVIQRLSEGFAQEGNAQFTIVITTQGLALSPENLASLDRYVKSVQAVPGVIAVQSLVTVSPDLTLAEYQQLYANPDLNPQITKVATNLANDDATKMTVAIQPADFSSEAATLVSQLRALDTPDGLTALVTGATPRDIDTLAAIEETLPQALLIIIGSIFLLLFLMTGSLIVPLKAIILNFLSLSATFGGLVWIFQDGYFQDLLQIDPPGSLDATLLVLIFAIAFGLSMDYEIFVLSRIKERFDETGNNRLAVASGIQSTGGLVTSAALLMAVVLAGFGLAETLSFQEIGVGLVIAVIVDATLIRLLLLPATMRLMGTFNWWAPAPLRWLWQYIGLSETEARPALAPASHVQAGRDKGWGQAPPLHPLREVFASDNGKTGRLSEPVQPAVEAQKQAKVFREEVLPIGAPNVISTRASNGEELMGPELLLWRSPDHVVNGSLLTVESNHFCVLKARGAILGVYETGQHIIETPDSPLSGSLQLAFDGEPILLEYEAIYISRAKLLVKMSDIALSSEMTKLNYSIDYYISVTTREDALRLLQHMPPYWRGHQGLHVQDINTYVRPVIEQAVNQLTQSTPLLSVGKWTGACPTLQAPNQGLRMQDLSQLVHTHLQQFLSLYGITLDAVNVFVSPPDERIKVLTSLKDFGLSERDAVHYYTAITQDSKNYEAKEKVKSIEKDLYIAWQNRLDRYKDEIAAIQAELERTHTDFGQALLTHSAHLLELSRVISTDLQAGVPIIDSIPRPEIQIIDRTGQFRAIDRGISTAPRPVEAGFAPESIDRRSSTLTSETHRA